MIRLVRIERTVWSTLGVVLVDGEYVCMSLERPWLDNARNISCVPCGTYPVRQQKHRTRGLVWRLDNVPGRDGIMIHSGNTVRDTHGCILVGTYVTGGPDSRRLVGSVPAIEALAARLQGVSDLSITLMEIAGGENERSV